MGGGGAGCERVSAAIVVQGDRKHRILDVRVELDVDPDDAGSPCAAATTVSPSPDSNDALRISATGGAPQCFRPAVLPRFASNTARSSARCTAGRSRPGRRCRRLSAFEQHRPVAEALDAPMSWVTNTIVRPLGLEPRELVEALLLERGVADREHLVDEQDVGIDLDSNREREPDLHPRGVVLELEVDELLELGERDDLVEARRAPPCATARA